MLILIARLGHQNFICENIVSRRAVNDIKENIVTKFVKE
jgi:hypothetical protein